MPATAMLQPHSFLWHYLWIAPCVLLAVLAFLTWCRGLHRLFPAFFVYMIFEAVQGLVLYALDRLPSVSDDTYWQARIVMLVAEMLVKLAVLFELLSHLVSDRPSVARMGWRLFTCVMPLLILLALIAASRAPIAKYAILSHSNILEQSSYLVETGFLLCLFVFASYFRLFWDSRLLGMSLGLSISACVGLGIAATNVNGIFFERHYLLDFLDMATYHACVLLWYYYLLWPPRRTALTTAASTDRSEGRPIRSSGHQGKDDFLVKAGRWGLFVTNSEQVGT